MRNAIPAVKSAAARPRWRKVLADLWESRSRTLLVVASIAVGVFAIGMIVGAYGILSTDINLSFAAVRPANIEISTDPFHQDLVRIIERVPGVTDAEGRRALAVRARRVGDPLWQSLNLIGADFSHLSINLLTPRDGTATPGVGELIVSQNFMRNTGFAVGDQIELELPDGSKHLMPLVGVVTDQATVHKGPRDAANAYVTLATLRRLGVDEAFNRLYVTIRQGDDLKAVQAAATQVEDRVEHNQRTVYRTDTRVSDEHPMASTILAVLGVLGALGILVMLLSSALIINTLNALLTQQMRQIGVMKLVGARSPQILGMYLILICAYAVIALALAVPAGAVAGYAFAEFIATLMGAALQGFRIVPAAVVLQVTIAFVVPLAAGFFPVRRGAETNVRRAIASDRPGDGSDGLGWMNRLTRWVQWISRPILLSIRNTFRQRGRLILTLFTLTVAGAVFIGVFNVRASMANFMEQLTQHFMGDVTMTFGRPYPVARIRQAVMPIPGVVSLEGWGGAAAEIVDQNDETITNLSVIAPPSDTKLLDPDIVAGRWLHPGEREAIVVSDSIYETFPHLKLGDQLRVKVPGIPVKAWTVVGVFRFVSMSGDAIAYADFDYMADLLDLPGQAASYRISTLDHTLEGQRALSHTIDAYLSDRGFDVRSVEAGRRVQEDAGKGIGILVIFLLIMALLTAFVGSIGLTGTMGMNVLDRTREIGVLRAIGAVDREIMKSVVIEGVMIALITWFFAAAASVPVSYGLLQIIGRAMMGSSIDLVLTGQGVVIWLAVVLLLAVVASLLPARNAARLT
ncbi:MAG TPA: FtsX-like permease family protein, partial [Anaerolineales bacterium]|nr:FtsX-like permease family protein [Anaerolineales bacterium]